MLIFKMYNLERLVCQQMQNANPNDIIISILGNIDDKGKQLEEDYEYVKSAIAIPYNEMLEHINYYNGCCEMDEAYEITFIQDLSKKYNLEPKKLRIVQSYFDSKPKLILITHTQFYEYISYLCPRLW